jgi:ascorbate-specific PTS system EIIC-type component UlaA
MVGLTADTHDKPGGWRPASWVVPLFGLAGILLVPWIVVLVQSLPSTQAAAHWDVAWGGFDVALALLLLGVAVAAWRRSPWLEGAASAAAALLFVDAWFDILTSATHLELGVAIGEAVLVELPLAALCLLLARDAERVLAGSARLGGD